MSLKKIKKNNPKTTVVELNEFECHKADKLDRLRRALKKNTVVDTLVIDVASLAWIEDEVAVDKFLKWITTTKQLREITVRDLRDFDLATMEDADFQGCMGPVIRFGERLLAAIARSDSVKVLHVQHLLLSHKIADKVSTIVSRGVLEEIAFEEDYFMEPSRWIGLVFDSTRAPSLKSVKLCGEIRVWERFPPNPRRSFFAPSGHWVAAPDSRGGPLLRDMVRGLAHSTLKEFIWEKNNLNQEAVISLLNEGLSKNKSLVEIEIEGGDAKQLDDLVVRNLTKSARECLLQQGGGDLFLPHVLARIKRQKYAREEIKLTVEKDLLENFSPSTRTG